MLSAPYKGAIKEHITQTYHDKHKALDIVGRSSFASYGTPLCAPEDCQVIRITGDTWTPETDENLRRGYGIYLLGLETGLTHFFWHTQPILPVYVGDIVKRGKIVAFMGNTGNVYSDGVAVPIEERKHPPYRGTHLHYELFDKGYRLGGAKRPLNPLDHIDWYDQPQYTKAELIAAYSIVLGKMSRLLSKK